MADKRIGELPAAPALYDDTLFAVEQQGVAKKLTGRQIKAAAGGGGGTGTGGVLPDGGTAGQVLAKRTDADQDAHWIDPPQSGTGGGFVEMETSIPVANRVQNTLYGLILQTYG